ncbi:hypothetical protein TSUD_293170 [Trifolium subterraneum]|uniref:Integrase catalytic domain-containing protein n=1 Tax=Trifolium subterraneum TaxID=3900 RepID=A0A2Z6MYT2_TRISU|nr:hypothetical protein TSUD_293170 [Trifolium subterraneum]
MRRLHQTDAIEACFAIHRAEAITKQDCWLELPTDMEPELVLLLNKFKNVFQQPTGLPPPRLQNHTIPLMEGKGPVKVRPYRYPQSQKEQIKIMIQEMLAEGIIQPSNNPFSSPIVLLKKKDGTWRFCTDYRALNAINVKDSFPMPTVDELLDELFGEKCFSKLDLSYAIWVDKCSCIIPMPNESDISTILKENNVLFVKLSKCSFGMEEVDYLGHTVSGTGVSMDKEKVQTVLDWPQPTSPLTDLLKKEGFKWTAEATLAFQNLKIAITTAPMLALPQFSLPFTIETDASGTGVGVVLGQGGHPIAFFSKKMSLQTPEQQAWLHKFIGYDFTVEYKPGKENIAADALSRQAKNDTRAPAGLLQPLPIPNQVWEDITIDFITGTTLSMSSSYHPQTDGQSEALNKCLEMYLRCLTFQNPKTWFIISDRDKVFISKFWKELFNLQGTTLSMSSAYHPQTDGQSEALNKCLEMYLRCLTFQNPKTWFKALDWAEYWYNTSHHTSLGMTPFQALYGRAPHTLVRCNHSPSDTVTVQQQLMERDELIVTLKDNLKRAQQVMKAQADKHRRNVHFEVAYKLQLPREAKIHPVFRISQLKPFKGQTSDPYIPLPLTTHELGPILQPMAVLKSRNILRKDQVIPQVLIKWESLSNTDVTWEDVKDKAENYPTFNLEDKIDVKGLPSKTNLVSRGILSLEAHHCVFGCGMAESAQHLFLSCSICGSLWSLISSWIGSSLVDSQALSEHFLQFISSAGDSRARRSFMQLIWLACVWVMWHERNQRLFRGSSNSLSQMLDKIKLLTYRWLKATNSNLALNYHSWWSSPLVSMGLV